jgi:hypothetical protein
MRFKTYFINLFNSLIGKPIPTIPTISKDLKTDTYLLYLNAIDRSRIVKSNDARDYFYKWLKLNKDKIMSIIHKLEGKDAKINIDNVNKIALTKLIKQSELNISFDEYIKERNKRQSDGKILEPNIKELEALMSWVKLNSTDIVEILRVSKLLPNNVIRVRTINEPSGDIRRIIARENHKTRIELIKQTKEINKNGIK